MKLNTFLTFVSLAICYMLSGCGTPQQTNRVSNAEGKYSVEIPAEWIYEIDGHDIRSTLYKEVDGERVSGTLLFGLASGMYDNLDDNFESGTSVLNTLENYRKISEGRTQVGGVASRWIRLNHSANNIDYTALQYTVQRQGNTMLLLNCSSTKQHFDLFEEEFNKVVFSLVLY